MPQILAEPQIAPFRTTKGSWTCDEGEVAVFARWALKCGICHPALFLKIFFCRKHARDLVEFRPAIYKSTNAAKLVDIS